jgi:predicted TIM-barrel fold metal-dependent hydrolase
MLEEHRTFESRAAADAGMIVDREPQPFRKAKLPQGLTVVSADNHVELTEDVFYQNFPARLRDAAPRVWFDKYWRVGFKETMEAYPTGSNIDAALTRSVLNDGFDFDVRNRHLDAEGIAKEIVYPQSLLAFIRHPDQELQQLMYSTYNEYIAKLGAENPGRFYGVGICCNWWDPKKAESAVRQIVDLGLKSFMLPFSPGKDVDGKPIDYAGSGGILDRHPKLRIVFAEGGINWVAGALQDAELTYGAHRELFDWPLKHRPSYYWHNHCYATFQTDPIGFKLIEQIGADRVMWAQDYPHSEGTFGYTADALAEITDAVSDADARKILGETALELYKLN